MIDRRIDTTDNDSWEEIIECLSVHKPHLVPFSKVARFQSPTNREIEWCNQMGVEHVANERTELGLDARGSYLALDGNTYSEIEIKGSCRIGSKVDMKLSFADMPKDKPNKLFKNPNVLIAHAFWCPITGDSVGTIEIRITKEMVDEMNKQIENKTHGKWVRLSYKHWKGGIIGVRWSDEQLAKGEIDNNEVNMGIYPKSFIELFNEWRPVEENNKTSVARDIPRKSLENASMLHTAQSYAQTTSR